jgi:hypothetical protein
MSQPRVTITLTEDDLVRLYETAARLTGGGEWLGDLVELWTEFRTLLFGPIEETLSPKLVERLDQVLVTLHHEVGRAAELEASYGDQP